MTFVWVVPCRVARCALNWLIDRLARETGFRLCGGRLGSVWDGSVWCAFGLEPFGFRSFGFSRLVWFGLVGSWVMRWVMGWIMGWVWFWLVM